MDLRIHNIPDMEYDRCVCTCYSYIIKLRKKKKITFAGFPVINETSHEP